jgi:SAM-dependent methyltransferase
MTFAVAADAYDRFMGRYSGRLAEALLDAAGVEPGMRALDVGAGPGALTGALAARLGSENVAAVEPSEPFVVALGERLPQVDVRLGSAERLPYGDGEFDAALAQLVVNFMADPARGVAEMRRVVRPGGLVAAAVWDYRGEMTLLREFWAAAARLDPERAAEHDEGRRMRFAGAGELAELFRTAGLDVVADGELVVSAVYANFDDLWESLTRGVGPAGAYVAALDADEQARLREELQRGLGSPAESFELSARAWYAVGTT